MRYKFYREHKYVSHALNELERLIAKTDFRNKIEVEQVKNQFTSLLEMLKGHADYENEILHKLLRDKRSNVYEQIEEDHKHYEETIEKLKKMLVVITEAKSEEDQIDSGYKFYIEYRNSLGKI